MFTRASWLAMAFGLVALTGCSNLDPSDESDPVAEDGKEDSLSKAKICGGIAGLTCPAGQTCVLAGEYPDASGKCVKTSQTCANVKCAKGTHCEMKGINGGAVPVCLKDTAATCAVVLCAPGTHCEMKGINGGAIPVCIQDPTQTCANVKCAQGTHCEMKGINGGAVPACIKDQLCGGIAGLQCPAGQKCHLDGSYPDASDTCVPETFCTTTADCSNLIHPMCVGAWQCAANTCSYHCGI